MFVFKNLFPTPIKSNKQTLWQPVVLAFFNAAVLVFFGVWVFFLADSVAKVKVVRSSDFVAFYTAGLLVRVGEGKNIYDLSTTSYYQEKAVGETWEGLILFRYLPFVALIFYIFSLLPLVKAFYIFLGINILLIIILLVMAKNFFKNLTSYKTWFLIPLSYYPVMLSMLKGQITILLTLLVFVVYFLFRKKPFWAGAVYSLLLIKPHFFLAGLPFFLLLSASKRKFVRGVILLSSLWLIVSIILVGFKPLLNYPAYTLFKERLVFQNTSEWVINFSLVSAITPLVRNFGVGLLGVYIVQAVIYIAVLYLFVRRYKELRYENALVATIFFMLIFSLHAYPYDFAIILVPIFIMLNWAYQKKALLKFIPLIILLLILPNITLAESSILNPIVIFFLGLKFSKIIPWRQ